jgi:hypothetical protein
MENTYLRSQGQHHVPSHKLTVDSELERVVVAVAESSSVLAAERKGDAPKDR